MNKIVPRNLDLEDSIEKINKLLDVVEKEAIKKETANNNINNKLSLDTVVRCIVESLGEASKAINKQRYEIVKAECLDLIYCVIILYIKANNLIIDNN